jgi:hypothetical protein
MPAPGNSKKLGISIREASRQLGVTDTALRKWIANKGFETLEDGSIDPKYLEAQAALMREKHDPLRGGKRVKGRSLLDPEPPTQESPFIEPTQAGHPVGATRTNISFEDVRKENILRTIRQQDLDYAVSAKTLVLAASVEKSLTDLGALVQASIDRLLDKLPAILAGESDDHKIRALLELHFDEAKRDMAHRAEQIGKGLTV